MFFTWEDIGKGNNSVHQYRTANYDPTNISAVHFLICIHDIFMTGRNCNYICMYVLNVFMVKFMAFSFKFQLSSKYRTRLSVHKSTEWLCKNNRLFGKDIQSQDRLGDGEREKILLEFLFCKIPGISWKRFPQLSVCTRDW